MPAFSRNRRSKRSRNALSVGRSIGPSYAGATYTAVANKLRVTCNCPVSTDGIPHIGLSAGAHTGTEYPTALTAINSTTFDLTYAHNVAAADVLHGDERDPAIRTRSGGFLAIPAGAVA